MLILNLDVQGENLYARLVGKLTKKETYKFHHYIIPYIQKEKIKNFICDCKELSKIDSEGKYALLKTKITMKKQKGNFFKIIHIFYNKQQGIHFLFGSYYYYKCYYFVFQ